MNKHFATRLARRAASHREPKPRDVMAWAIRYVTAGWDKAAWKHTQAGTTPADLIPMDAEQEQANWLMQVARNGGC